MKYIVNTKLEGTICSILSSSIDAQMFWLAFFKPQLSCPADEFIEALRQVAEFNGMGYYYYNKYQEWNKMMESCDFVVSLEEHADLITKIIGEFVSEALQKQGVTPLGAQFKLGSMDESAN